MLLLLLLLLLMQDVRSVGAASVWKWRCRSRRPTVAIATCVPITASATPLPRRYVLDCRVREIKKCRTILIRPLCVCVCICLSVCVCRLKCVYPFNRLRSSAPVASRPTSTSFAGKSTLSLSLSLFTSITSTQHQQIEPIESISIGRWSTHLHRPISLEDRWYSSHVDYIASYSNRHSIRP